MVSLILPLLLAASPALPTSFVAPKGWIAKPPPTDHVVDFIWLSPHFGVDGNGENLSITVRALPAGTTLDAEVRNAKTELSQGRDIVASHSEPTCRGLQPGWALDAHLPLPNSKTLSQLYHLTIINGRLYTFIFTHLAGDAVDPAITASIQSVCPPAKSA